MNVCGGGSGPSAFFGEGESAPLLSPFLCLCGEGDARLLTSDFTLPGILVLVDFWRLRPWFLRAAVYSEPNGDYTAGCWLSALGGRLAQGCSLRQLLEA